MKYPDSRARPKPRRRPDFVAAVGWIAAVLAAAFGVAAVVLLVQQEWAAALAETVLGAVLARFARDWLKRDRR